MPSEIKRQFPQLPERLYVVFTEFKNLYYMDKQYVEKQRMQKVTGYVKFCFISLNLKFAEYAMNVCQAVIIDMLEAIH